MTTYFNTIIPIKIFLEIAGEIMHKYDVKFYVEKMSTDGNKKRRYYVKENISEKDFFDEEYGNFFFSMKDIDITDKEIILESGNVIHSNWISFYDEFSIEGEGGRENSDNIECVKLRIISKEPDKQIKEFYSAFQAKFKKIENIKQHKVSNFKIYYIETGKKMWSDFQRQIPFEIK